MSSAELLEPRAHSSARARRFGVAWRNPARKLIAPVGVLDHGLYGYRFQYLDSVGEIPGFKPFVGFPDLGHTYRSRRLWPFFGLRVMDRKRPDYESYVRWLGLGPGDAPLDVLSRSGGEQKGDSVYLAEEPSVAEDGSTESIFLVRGSSYAVRAFHSAQAANSLVPGDLLQIADDVDNEANSAALLLRSPLGPAVGWIPDLLIDYTRAVRDGGGTLTVVQNNGPAAPWHVRLLVRVLGRVEPDLRVFSRPPWPGLV